MGMKSKDKKAAEVLGMLVETDFDDVQIAYEADISVPTVKRIIRDAMNYYKVNRRDLLIQCLEEDVYV